MEESPEPSSLVGAGVPDDDPRRAGAADADAPAAGESGEREEQGEVPLVLLRCLNKTHQASCLRCV